MKAIYKILMTSLISLSLTACNTGLFDKDNTPAPTPLSDFKPEANVQTNWYLALGNGYAKDHLRLVPGNTENNIYTVDNEGNAAAVEKTTGRVLWKTSNRMSVTGGAGAGDNIIVIGSREGNVMALDQTNGKMLWFTKTSSEIYATPTIKHGIALVKTIDGKVTAYSSHNGHVLWTYQQLEPNLILRGASAPQMNNNFAVIGFANGNLVKLNLKDGGLYWQKTMAIPQGSFAIQRMIDIDANPLLYGNRIYAATYQGQISALESGTGENIWTHEISSYTGIDADSERVYITDARSRVWAFDAKSGAVDWQQPQLIARNITGPTVMGNYIVVGDGEGYLHWLSKQDGHLIARIRVNKSGITATPVVNNNVLYVLTKDGHLASYSLG